MDIKALATKYKLGKDDFWEMKRNGQSMWIIRHDACEKIALKEKIVLDNIQVLNTEWDFCRLIITMKKGDVKISSIGEALLNTNEVIKKNHKGLEITKGNCESQYIGSMAEKRGIDRCVLKLINAYEYGIYSDVEADSFKKPDTKPQEETYEKATEAQKKLIDSLMEKISSNNTAQDVQRLLFEALSYSGASSKDGATKTQATKLIDYLKNNS